MLCISFGRAETRVDSGLDQFQTKAVVQYSGEVKWMAPAVMKLSCQVDVTYFPYDTQVHKMAIQNGYISQAATT